MSWRTILNSLSGGDRTRIPVWRQASEVPLVPNNLRLPGWKIGIGALTMVACLAGGVTAFRAFNWMTVAGQLSAFAVVVVAWRPSLLPTLTIVGALVILLLWKLPNWQVERSRALTDDKRFDRENEARKTLAQIIGGAFLLASLYSSVQTLDLSRQGQLTDRFTKAIEQLGALDAAGKPKLEVRLGGIYALERIARDSERDHSIVMEVLTAYVRQHSPLHLNQASPSTSRNRRTTKTIKTIVAEDEEALIGADIQAILTVIGRRDPAYDRVPINLSGADLRGADLDDADLRHARFTGVNLSGADLIAANLNHVIFLTADLSHALLEKADLRDAALIAADLHGASLRAANLGDADLSEADVRGADLREVVNLSQEQINSAHGDGETKLPAGLKKPDSWK